MNSNAPSSAALKSFKKIGYNSTLAKSFSPKVINELAETGVSDTLTGILRETRAIESLDLNQSLGNFFDLLYQHLINSYRNEYVYKNAITQKLLLNRPSLKTSNIFSEFRVSSSKADIMIVNGTSNIHEIKTDLDNLDRLSKQLRDYQKFSEFVSVVTSSEQSQLIENTVGLDIGILILSSGFRLTTVRDPVSGIEMGKLAHDTIFDSLRRNEYTSILENEYGLIPDFPNTMIHSECKKLFRNIDITKAHSAALDVLKKRTQLVQRRATIDKYPKSLKLVAATTDMSEDRRAGLLNCLTNKTKNSLILKF